MYGEVEITVEQAIRLVGSESKLKELHQAVGSFSSSPVRLTTLRDGAGLYRGRSAMKYLLKGEEIKIRELLQ